MADGYEICTEWYHRYELCDKMLTKIKQGWKVLYTVHMPDPPPVQPFWQYSTNNSNAPVCTSVMNPDGSMTSSVMIPIHTPAPQGSYHQAEPMIEVVYYQKNWEKDPCPRCSFPYPNPDEISREV